MLKNGESIGFITGNSINSCALRRLDKYAMPFIDFLLLLVRDGE
jgi:hypothetical protein